MSRAYENFAFGELKMLNFRPFLFFGVYSFCQHFTENPLFISNKILTIIMSIPPTCFDAFARTNNICKLSSKV